MGESADKSKTVITSLRQSNRIRLAEVSMRIVSQHNNTTLFKVDISFREPEFLLMAN